MDQQPAACVLATAGSIEGCAVLAVAPWQQPTEWSLPGGLIEPGESAAEAALRECVEETGLRPLRLVPLLKARERGRMVRTFWATALYGQLRSSAEGQARWVDWRVVLNGPHGWMFEEALVKLMDEAPALAAACC